MLKYALFRRQAKRYGPTGNSKSAGIKKQKENRKAPIQDFAEQKNRISQGLDNTFRDINPLEKC